MELVDNRVFVQHRTPQAKELLASRYNCQMRIYLPLAVAGLFEPHLNSRNAWQGSADFCQLWGVDPLDSEQAEDLAMSMSAMSCLEGKVAGYPGRIVAALDVNSQELGAENAPGVFAVKSGFDWQRLVSLHVDSADNLELCTQVRAQVPAELAAAWSHGDFSDIRSEMPEDGGTDLPEADSARLELWEQLAAEPLSWFDASELDYLREALAENAVP
ncbi:hypothetical protein [uncultured Varibaculum sp.]|uniref:DUF6912 family protein n=1 Tax=uncultured Varibaculum sp. TaxID=413896 RepID=UPI0027D9AF9E|nr:hypothetical protein [uncultured Varibaculum sp.]